MQPVVTPVPNGYAWRRWCNAEQALVAWPKWKNRVLREAVCRKDTMNAAQMHGWELRLDRSKFKWGRILVMLLLSFVLRVSLADATTWEQWERFHHDQKATYVAGAVDMWRILLSLEMEETSASDRFIHRLNKCLATRHLSNHELAEIVEKYGQTHQESPVNDVVLIVIASLEDFCGLRRTPN